MLVDNGEQAFHNLVSKGVTISAPFLHQGLKKQFGYSGFDPSFKLEKLKKPACRAKYIASNHTNG
jgi:hypothetical protein